MLLNSESMIRRDLRDLGVDLLPTNSQHYAYSISLLPKNCFSTKNLTLCKATKLGRLHADADVHYHCTDTEAFS